MTTCPGVRISMLKRLASPLAFLLVILGLGLQPGIAIAAPTLADLLAMEPERRWSARVTQVWPQVRAFYDRRDNAPLWLEQGKVGPRARTILAILEAAEAEGLDPAHFGVAQLTRLLADPSAAPALIELQLTGQLLHFVGEMRRGRFSEPEFAEKDTFRTLGAIDPASILDRLASAPDPLHAVRGMAPGNVVYRGLRQALAAHRRMMRAGNWPEIAAGPVLKPGMTDPRVPALRARLLATGDVFARQWDPASPVHDQITTDSVMMFQRRHGLEVDGVVGRSTLAEMNVPLAARIDQIILNMERWRWMPDDLGDRYILVNLAGFELDVFDAGSSVMNMRVVVGGPFRRTPVFSAQMSYLELNPTWTLPPTILKEDVLPRLSHDSTYLSRRGIEVFDGWRADSRQLDPSRIDWQSGQGRLMGYRYVQRPGPKNALGQVKFMFPNAFSIYLHDTPEREQFARPDRAVSSGCIRVQRPLELAAYLLADQAEWSPAAIRESLDEKRPRRINLSRSVAVHMTYSTAWVGEGGTMQYRADVYDRDADLRQSLAAVAFDH